jgi:hypothetical protein
MDANNLTVSLGLLLITSLSTEGFAMPAKN